MPQFKTTFYIEFGIGYRPSVDPRQMRDGSLVISAHSGETYMLDLVAGRAEGDQFDKLLHALLIVVGEHLMTFDRPFLSASSAHFTNVARAAERYFFEPLPFRRRNIRADVAIPGGLRHKLYGQQLFHARFSLSLTRATKVLRSWQVA